MAQIEEIVTAHFNALGHCVFLYKNQDIGIQNSTCGPLIKLFPLGCKLLKAENQSKACPTPTRPKTLEKRNK